MSLSTSEIMRLVEAALNEDRATQDATSRRLFKTPDRARASAVLKGGEAVCCGLEFVRAAFSILDPGCRFESMAREGQALRRGDVAFRVSGRALGLLAAERVALNFLCHLSGIATLTRRYVQALPRLSRVMISDTRKSHPLLRGGEKYAVAVGGGSPHRSSLADMVMVKDNHLALLRRKHEESWPAALGQAIRRWHASGLEVEVEAEDRRSALKIAAVKPDWIMLDNIVAGVLEKTIVSLRRAAPRIKIEVSGGVTLVDIPRLGSLDVDRISSGALVYAAQFTDFSLEFR